MSPEDITRLSVWLALTLIFGGGLWMVIGSIFIFSEEDKLKTAFWTFISLFVIPAILLGAGTLVVSSAGRWEAETIPLVALQDGSGVSGNFFLGSGYIKNDLTYYYYQQGSDSGIYGKTVKAEKAVIYEDQEDTPIVREWHCMSIGASWQWAVCVPRTETEFHVPKGSVLSQYKMDLN